MTSSPKGSEATAGSSPQRRPPLEGIIPNQYSAGASSAERRLRYQRREWFVQNAAVRGQLVVISLPIQRLRSAAHIYL